jgi:hypothetical protein
VSAEGVFAQANEAHGLRHTRFTGRWKVQIHLWLTAAVINIKRAVRALTKAEPVAVSQEVTDRASIAGMFAHAAKEIARFMHRILVSQSTSAAVPSGDVQKMRLGQRWTSRPSPRDWPRQRSPALHSVLYYLVYRVVAYCLGYRRIL